jgi:hypothetical protein
MLGHPADVPLAEANSLAMDRGVIPPAFNWVKSSIFTAQINRDCDIAQYLLKRVGNNGAGLRLGTDCR